MSAKFNALGLRQRLFRALSIPLVLILVGSSLLDYRLARKTVDLAHDQSLADNVFDLEASMLSRHAFSPEILNDESRAMLRSASPDIPYFAIKDARGKLLGGVSDLPDIEASTQTGLEFFDRHYKGRPVRVAVHRVWLDQQEILITVAETTEARQQAVDEILTAMLLPNLAVVIVVLLAVYFGVRHGLLPLKAVEKEIASRSASDLHEIDLANAPVEIHPMLSRLNELFLLLRHSAKAQQLFIADAAHQLRTPLSGLQTQIDLAAGEGAFNGHEERLAQIDHALSRQARLLGQLLAYARAERVGTLVSAFETVQLNRLVEESASLFLDAALAKDIDLGFEIAPCSVDGLPWMLQEALSNLVDNAIRYTPRGGVVTVRCGVGAGQPFLEVEDSGPGIPEEYRERIFERFFRIPGMSGDGCGLGLAIVDEIAKLHAAKVSLAHAPSGGLRVSICFAVARPGSF